MSKGQQFLTKLGDEFVQLAMGVMEAWKLTKQRAQDPVTLERFALNCHTAAQALIQLAEAARNRAGDILDGDED
jgi:hypothetical protein